MPYEPIHHKYRPQTFKDLVGQETIALTLSNALKQTKIAPAYLFTGPRGTGKTSSARILAKSLNCLNSDRPTPDPCGKCEACLAIAKGSALDVMEIDAASNTGVDNIREIIERSRFAPVQCRYKIYCIDECHMLSTAAFNALLKTLEEPPPQVVFILATTDPQRVLSTIISRCQRFDYRRIPLPEMVSHLRYIADREKIAIANEALTLVAQIANGGLRDAESLLDQLSLLPDTIYVEKVWDLVGAVPEQDLLKLLHVINHDNSLGVLEQCRSLLDRGREPIVVLQNLASFYLNLLIAKTAPQRPDMVAVTETCWQQLCQEAASWDTGLILRGQQHLKEAETQLKRTTQPRLWLEVTLLGLLPQAHQAIASQPIEVADLPQNNTVPITQQKQPQTSVSPQNTSIVEQPVEVKQVSPPPIQQPEAIPQATVAQTSVAPPPEPIKEPAPAVVSAPVANTSNVDTVEIWGKVLSCLQPPTTQALLKQQCHLISFDGSSATVGISSATLQKLNQGKVPNIEKAFAQVVQHKVRVQLEVAAPQNNLAKKNSTIANNLVESVPEAQKAAENTSEINSNGFNSLEEVVSSKPVNSKIAPLSEDVTIERLTTPPIARQPIPENSVAPFSTTPVTPIETVTPPPPLIEQDLNVDYEDNDLQKAIANLTQSFEGDLVEMDSDQNLTLATSEVAESESPAIVQEHGRPSIEDYEDDW